MLGDFPRLERRGQGGAVEVRSAGTHVGKAAQLRRRGSPPVEQPARGGPELRPRGVWLGRLEREVADLEREHLNSEAANMLGQFKEKTSKYHATVEDEVKHMGKYAVALSYGKGE
ncbi:hypothetical protein NDU88_001255 [Pleurodeles waltl]|uniref:Uncharacterized protein n=1 Tax=Pleurodeles waltl TaxID=8319 RepID=A0AAV7THS4_PLEWA|nr:hypothetical protein NDU88_001255 [Pleurodeles waltl]